MPHQRLHPLELFGGRRTIVVANFMNPHGCRADKRRDVCRDTFLLELFEIFAKRGPGDRVAQITLLVDLFTLHSLGERPHRRPFAEHLERDALPDVALGFGIDEERLVRPTEHVDEARRDRESGGIDVQTRRCILECADRGDPVALDPDRQLTRRAAAAVVDEAVTDEDVVFGCAAATCGGKRDTQDENGSSAHAPSLA